MLYPAYVHHDEGSAYGLTFPDFPGCHAAADAQDDILAAAQEAVEAHFYGESDIPAASELAAWGTHPDYQDGFWMLVDIDLSKVSTKAIRLNISLPENLVHKIDAAASAQHLSRSAFLAKAALKELAEV